MSARGDVSARGDARARPGVSAKFPARFFVSVQSRLPARLRSTRAQLIVWNAATLALLFALLGLVLRLSVHALLLGSVDRELRARTHRVLEQSPLTPHPHAPPNGALPNGAEPLEASPPSNADSPEDRETHTFQMLRPRVMNARGQIVIPPNIKTPWDAHAFSQALQGRDIYTTIDVAGEPVRILSRPFPRQGAVQGVVQAPYPLNDIHRAIAGINLVLLCFLPVALACAGVGGALLTNRALRSVHHLTQAAQGIGNGGSGTGSIGARGLSERLPVVGEDEFSALSATFNGMLARLETAFQEQETLVQRLERMIEQQRRFTADASHELRTPLTSIKANTSLCLSSQPSMEEYRESIEEIDRAAATMSHLVNNLLLLARSDEGQLLRRQTLLPVREVIEKAVAGLPHGQEDRAPIEVEISDPALYLYGSETEMVRLLTNLLDNAARYTPAPGQITVRAVREDKRLLLQVRDSGAGIAAEHLPHLGERFYRADTSRSRPGGGTGLGLAICRSIVEAHGGILTIDSAPGVGTVVTVTLPLPLVTLPPREPDS